MESGMTKEDSLFGIRGDRLYTKEDYHFGKGFIIPAGFSFDVASIPRACWSIIGHPFMDEFRIGALEHDWIFITHCATFTYANILFLNRLKQRGVGWARRNAMYLAVSSVGIYYWNTEDRAELLAIHRILRYHPLRDKIEAQIKKPYYKQLMNECI
jgi:hypothetical protein